jgi:hypothetical protein
MMEERDTAFIRDVSTFGFVESSYPGMVERLQALHESEIGRTVYLARQDGDSQAHLMIGIILPLNFSQTEHIVIFRNGEMVKTTYVDTQNRNTYIEKMAPNNNGVIFMNSSLSIDDIPDEFDDNHFTKSKVVLKGDTPEITDELNRDLDAALRNAVELKTTPRSEKKRRSISDEQRKIIAIGAEKALRSLDELEALLAPESLSSFKEKVVRGDTVFHDDNE